MAASFFGPLKGAGKGLSRILGKADDIADGAKAASKVPRVTDELLAASKRIGLNLDDMKIVDGVAHLKIHPITESFSRADLRLLLDFAKASGATSVRLNTGMVTKPSIYHAIEHAIETGRPYLGGRPVFVREVGPSVFPGAPPIRIYDIIFDL